MDYGTQLTYLADAAYQLHAQDEGMRRHLGASVIGQKCLRAIWFGFRWADGEQFDGRMLRLFNRGQKEEPAFAELLRLTGATVWTHDANGDQFRVSALGGHFGGSMDGVARGLPYLPADLPVLLEMKTHNDKSFKGLLKDGLRGAKPQHFNQAQVYMKLANLTHCLYCAVNKNDDSLFFHLFEVDTSVGHHLLARAESVIYGSGLPPRISETPSWFECRFCSMSGVCFKQKLPRLNCRTCRFSKPERDGTWSCEGNQPEVKDSPKSGCVHHQYIPELC